MISSVIAFSVLLMISFENAFGQSQPCVSYRAVTDPCLMDSYVQGSSTVCSSQSHTPWVWLRYTGSTDGVLATSPPAADRCSTPSHIWMESEVPDQKLGVQMVHICVSNPIKPCGQRTRMELVNCGLFVVYRFNGTIPSEINFCFNATHTSLTTTSTSTTTSTTTTTTRSTTTTPTTTTSTTATTTTTTTSTTTPTTTTSKSMNTITSTTPSTTSLSSSTQSTISITEVTTAQKPITGAPHSTTTPKPVHRTTKASSTTPLPMTGQSHNENSNTVAAIATSTAVLGLGCILLILFFCRKRIKKLFNRMKQQTVGPIVMMKRQPSIKYNSDTVSKKVFNGDSLVTANNVNDGGKSDINTSNAIDGIERDTGTEDSNNAEERRNGQHKSHYPDKVTPKQRDTDVLKNSPYWTVNQHLNVQGKRKPLAPIMTNVKQEN